jgi:hypothetical protein
VCDPVAQLPQFGHCPREAFVDYSTVFKLLHLFNGVASEEVVSS